MQSRSDESRASRVAKAAGAIALGTLVGALLTEGMVRLVVPEQPLIPRNVVDSGFGVRTNLPDVSYRQFYPGNFEARVSVNRAGLRSRREYAPQKPEGAYRIALLGDSFAFGYGITDGQVVGELLEDALNRDPALRSRKFEVLNFSVSGTSQGEQLLIYRNQVRAYAPDRVVLFYYNNDIGENVVSDLFAVDGSGSLQPTGRSYLPAVGLSELVGRSAPLRWLSENSQAFGFLRVTVSHLAKKRWAEQKGFEEYDDGGEDAAPLTRALVTHLVREVGRDADPVLYLIPDQDGETNFPLTPEEVRASGAAFVDGRDTWARRQYFPMDLHWNAEGHRNAAAALHRLLRAELLAPTGS